ncbi:hypothetical protein [Sulfitobacter sp. 1A12157]|uniref:hypothetical protein n=1 Tax=Sulfitobacter sp. 1A12157 TaxID=3368594 RepID=UPI0037472025
MDNPDLALGVEFFTSAVENPRKTKEAGRPIFEDRECVRIRFPADNKRELVAPAGEMHYVSHAKTQMTYADRFPAAYDAFKKNEAQFVEGTPLSEMPSLTEAKRAELRSQNVQTVEQLANLPDATMKRMGMGSRALVEAAQDYLERATGLGEVAALKARIAELESSQVPETDSFDEFADLDDEDLRNMLTDAGVKATKGWERKRLVSEARALAKKKEAA